MKIKFFLKAIKDFFPIHLLFSHFKYNIIVLFYWFFLFAVINGYLADSFGGKYLFLSPEYLGETNALSFLLMGFSFGGLVMAFNTYSYIRLAPKYPFIATLARPFFKFSINNSLIPLLLLINFVFNIWMFQRSQEFVPIMKTFTFVLAFLLGVTLFILLSLLYFFPTNKDIFKITGKKQEDFNESLSSIKASFHRKQKWHNAFLASEDDTYYYIGRNYKIRRSRSCKHYDIDVLNQVFNQNHVNASIFEMALIASFFIIGLFKDLELFQVPASVSVMLFFTIIIMIVSSLFSWFKAWTYPIIFSMLFFINYLSKETDFFRFQSYAFGLSYEAKDEIPFNQKSIVELGLDGEAVDRDKVAFLETLKLWKAKTGEDKPKLILLNTSGGGLRSAMWTFTVMQNLDSCLNDKLSKHLQLITGASGGMIGAAYYRDLLLHERSNEQIEKDFSKNDKKYVINMSDDLLNRIAFSITTNDIFFRFQKFEYNGRRYTKDRGYAFEQELISNLEGALSGTLGDYYLPEKEALIPTMIFSPTIVNDGRRLIVGAQQLAFLNASLVAQTGSGLIPGVENVEYQKYFSENTPQDIAFSTVLRMSATFPYIMPMVTMPTSPSMQIMDAGIRDNYGTKITVQYLLALENWIAENTSGVIILKIRDSKKYLTGNAYKQIGFLDKFLLPFGNMYGNFPRVQDFDQDELWLTKLRQKKFPIDFVTFNLRQQADDKISLSWHLTQQEKQKIIQTFYTDANQTSLQRLKSLMGIERN